MGEVLGVFAEFEIGNRFTGNKSTVRVKNLRSIEDSLTELWSPLWPASIKPIDETLRKTGEAIYMDRQCWSCHSGRAHADKTPFDRTNPSRTVTAWVGSVNTDGSTFNNFIKVPRGTGILKGRPKSFIHVPLLTAVFGDKASSGEILANVVIGTIVGSPFPVPSDELSKISFTTPSFGLTSPNADELPQANYKARPLNGIWATAPYLHNGSVPTLWDLLSPAAERPKNFKVGSREFDPEKVGFKTDEGSQFDTTIPGNGNGGHEGHEFGTDLNPDERKALIEYLKSL